MKNSFKKIFLFAAGLSLIILMLLLPGVGRGGAADGLVLCGGVVVPSLFPFTFCVLLLMRSGIQEYLCRLDSITATLFRLNGSQFAVFILSLIGGYPVGARLVDELYSHHATDRKTAQALLCCCVNSGPGFTVLFAGEGILGSKSAGYCLLAAHILSSFILLILLRGRFCPCSIKKDKKMLSASISENFVSSAADAAASMLSICAFVILFSAVNAYILRFSSIRNLVYFTEVTGGITLTRNIYFIAFLLGFGGISVWFQVLSVTRSTGIDLPLFVLFRILHGTFSAALTAVLIKVFGVSVMTLSNGISFGTRTFYSTAGLAAALFIMVVIFFISLFGKNRSRNLSEDMI